MLLSIEPQNFGAIHTILIFVIHEDSPVLEVEDDIDALKHSRGRARAYFYQIWIFDILVWPEKLKFPHVLDPSGRVDTLEQARGVV